MYVRVSVHVGNFIEHGLLVLDNGVCTLLMAYIFFFFYYVAAL